MERGMPKSQLEAAAGPPASHDDLKRILGDIEDAKIIEILGLKPTIGDVEEAAVWLAGNGDVLAKSGHPLSRVAAAIADIVSAGEEEEPR
jgi:hypothetical protein